MNTQYATTRRPCKKISRTRGRQGRNYLVSRQPGGHRRDDDVFSGHVLELYGVGGDGADFDEAVVLDKYVVTV